jgi:tRNA A37 threonylcarbamoyladenosine modification protein TsaB
MAIDDVLLPHAADIARLAVLEVRAGRTCRAAELAPVYLRNDVAARSSRT